MAIRRMVAALSAAVWRWTSAKAASKAAAGVTARFAHRAACHHRGVSAALADVFKTTAKAAGAIAIACPAPAAVKTDRDVVSTVDAPLPAKDVEWAAVQ